MAENNNTSGNDLNLKSVLIARFSALGNVVMTIPVIYSACRCYSDVQFVLLTRKSLIPLFVNAPENLTIEGIDLRTQYTGIGGARRLLQDMREKYHIEAFIDLQNDKSTDLLAFFCRWAKIKTVRFNRAMHNKRELTRKTNKVMLPLISSRARYRETFFKAGLPIEENFGTLYSPLKHAPAEEYLPITQNPKPDDIKWVGIAPFAAHPEKEYPTERMDEVIRMILERGDSHIFIFGGDGREQTIAEEWAKKYQSITSLAGKRYGFAAELALVSNLDVMLTMDSANMHMAAIAGTPTVSIWGATHHYCGFKGWHQSENDMVQAPLSCRPCSIKGDKECFRHDRLCLTAIRPETVYAKLAEKI